MSLSWSRNTLLITDPDGLLPCPPGHSTGPYTESAESSPHSHIISLRFMLILSSIYANVLSTVLLPSVFRLIFSAFLSTRACYMSNPSHPPWFGHPNNIRWSVQVVKLLIMQSYPSS